MSKSNTVRKADAPEQKEITTFAQAVQARVKVDTAEINRAALKLEVLQELWPDGHMENFEFCLASLQGGYGNSCKINIANGGWSEFNGGAANYGVVSMFAKAHNLKEYESAEYLADRLRIVPTSEVILPVPENAEPLEDKLGVRQRIARTATYEYRDTDGSLLGYTIRVEYPGKKKQVPVFTYRLRTGWTNKGWDELLPMFGMEYLARDPEGPVLLVEGEKTAIAARELMRALFPKMVVLTWRGGCKPVDSVWWGPLKGREVILWPDNDRAGRDCMRKIARLLETVEAKKISIVQVPAHLEKGWDLADWNSETGFKIQDLINGAHQYEQLADLVHQFVYISKTDNYRHTETYREYSISSLTNTFGHLQPKLGKIMLEMPELTKVDQVTFWPDQPQIVIDNMDGYEALCFNLWRDLGVEECEGDTTVFEEHCDFIFPNTKAKNDFLDFLAYQVQFPGEKVNWAPLLQGEQGAGKSYFGKVMRAILGGNAHPAASDLLTKQWSHWLEARQFIIMEEVMVAGRREVTNRMKPWITEDWLSIERKGENEYQVPNRANFLLLTNFRDALVIDDDDRRFMVYFSPAVKKEATYYKRLFEDLPKNAGAIKQLLLGRNLSNFDAKGCAPQTEYKKEMAQASRPKWEIRIGEMREAGIYPFKGGLVTVEEVRKSLDSEGLRGMDGRAIGKALGRMGAVALGQKTLPNHERHSVWAYEVDENTAGMTDGEIKSKFEMKMNAVF